MWNSLETVDSSVLNDLGVSWGHNSELYISDVRFSQFCDTPVAKWPIRSQLGIERDRTGMIGLSDPLARQLCVADTIREHAAIQERITTPQEAWASSILRVHEPIHAGLTEHFTHLYGQPRLLSFTRTLRFVHEGPNRGAQSMGKRVLEPLLTDAWQTLQQSEFVQEAAAFRAQREFLKQFNHPGRSPKWKKNVEFTRWHRLIDQHLDEGNIPNINTNSDNINIEAVIGHAFGDWLGERVRSQPWKEHVDPLDFAFRLHISATQNDGGGTAPPNIVLLAAASLSADELEDLGAQQQLSLLVERVEDRLNASYGTVVTQVGDGSKFLPEDYQVIDPMAAFDSWRNVNFHRNVNSNDWYIVPLNAVSYPGKSEKSAWTLWNLLDGLASDVVNRNGQLVRRLWLETEYEQAKGTPLLTLALQLWHLRDHTLLPLIRAYERTSSTNVDAYLSDARDIIDGKTPPGRIWGKVDSGDILDEQARRLHERTPEIRERYGDLFNGLEVLGRAIHDNDKKTVGEFY